MPFTKGLLTDRKLKERNLDNFEKARKMNHSNTPFHVYLRLVFQC
jgi:hypothetical protein